VSSYYFAALISVAVSLPIRLPPQIASSAEQVNKKVGIICCTLLSTSATYFTWPSSSETWQTHALFVLPSQPSAIWCIDTADLENALQIAPNFHYNGQQIHLAQIGYYSAFVAPISNPPDQTLLTIVSVGQ
jgi:hypothetical protein